MPKGEIDDRGQENDGLRTMFGSFSLADRSALTRAVATHEHKEEDSGRIVGEVRCPEHLLEQQQAQEDEEEDNVGEDAFWQLHRVHPARIADYGDEGAEEDAREKVDECAVTPSVIVRNRVEVLADQNEDCLAEEQESDGQQGQHGYRCRGRRSARGYA